MADLVTQEAAHGLNQVTFTAAAAGDTVGRVAVRWNPVAASGTEYTHR